MIDQPRQKTNLARPAATTVIQLLTNIDLLRDPERPPSFLLSTLTLRHSLLRTAERARMPETALLSAFIFYFQNSILKVHFLGNLKFLLPICLNSCFWEYHILPGHRLLSLLAERSGFSLNEAFINTGGPSLMISPWLITSSSAQLRPEALAQQRSASSAAQRRAVPYPAVPCRALPCPAVPCHALPCGAVLCDAVRCCAVLCRAVPW